MTEVLTFGECMLALRCQGLIRLGASMTTSIAGAEATVAIGLSRLGHRVRWIGRVGADESGEMIARTLRAEAVAADVIADTAAPTGIIVFEQRLPDVTRVEYHRRDSAGSRLEPADVADALSRSVPRVLHLTGITAALSASALRTVEHAVTHARAAGVAISLDLNYRRTLWDADRAAGVLGGLAERADLVIGSDDEFELIGRTPQDLLTGTPHEVIVKRGEHGAIGHARDTAAIHAPARKVAAVDSVGAGDAFCAGYLSGWLDGLTMSDRLSRATTVAAFAVGTRGDWEGMPTRAELGLADSSNGAVQR